MKIEHVEGENKGKVMLYALSTCGWCRKTRQLLEDLGVEYHYVYVDHEVDEEKNAVMDTVRKWNPACSFPTLVIDDEDCIVGFKEDKIKEALGI